MSQDKPVHKFRLLRGIHQQREPAVDELGKPTNEPCENCGGHKKIEVPSKRGEFDCTYCFGTGLKHAPVEYNSRNPKKNIVHSTVDLERKMGRDKFQKLGEPDTGTPGEDSLKRKIAELEAENARLKEDRNIAPRNLEGMTVSDLKNYAKKQGIDLEPGLRKEEIINTIEFELQSQ